MKRINFVVIFGFLLVTSALNAQKNKEEVQKVDKQTYYEQRAREDAVYEQSLQASELEDEEDFWESQQVYEKNLKKRDRKAYRAYMKGKRTAYAEHAEHCDHHHHHSVHFYYYAGHYYSSPRYSSYRSYYYNPGTRVSVHAPAIGVRVGGIF